MAQNQNPFWQMFGFGGPTGGNGGSPFGGSGQGTYETDDGPAIDFNEAVDFSKAREHFANMTKKAWVITIIVAVLILAAAYWWFHPALNVHSLDLWLFVAFVCLVIFVILWGRKNAYRDGRDGVEPSPSKERKFKHLAWIPAAVIIVFLIGALASASFIPGNAKKYSEILAPTDMEFTEDIQEVDYDQIPVIDRDSAVILGNRTMGAMSDLVSQFEISSLYSQINYNDRPVRVSPLTYADLFKWLQNREPGIPAYVIVDMTTQDAQVVRLDDEHAIKYSESEPLARNIDRYVQLKYPFYMFGTKSFEIDDEGNAWWVCPVRDFSIGLFGGETISRAVLVNAATGETQDLAVDEVPEWVDRVYPSDLLIQQYNWHGLYSSGWLNSWLGQNGVVQTTPGSDGDLGYNYIAKDDDVWMYTGVTSATSDNSIIGFVLVNQRTAEAHFYSVAGATEESAMESAEGQVQNLRYSATFPILINVSNTPTYFMALKDSAGLVKKYAMVDIQRYQNVAVGDTVADTQKNYLALLATNGVLTGDTSTEGVSTASGTIRTMAQAVIDSNTHFYVTLEGQDGIYDFVLPGMIEIVGYGVGDEITFTYVEGDPTSTVQAILTDETTGQDTSTDTSESSSSTADTSSDSTGGTTSDASSTSSDASTSAESSESSSTDTGEGSAAGSSASGTSSDATASSQAA